MPSRTEDDPPQTPSRSQLLDIVTAGRHGDAQAALRRVAALVPGLEIGRDTEPLLVALWGRAELLWRADAPFRDVVSACDLLEQAAQERLQPLWAAVARTLRATAHLDAGDVGACMTDLAMVDLEQVSGDAGTPGGGELLDLLATVYGRLRLHERADDVRGRAEQSLAGRPPVDRAVHWAHRASELAVRALEPVATGADDPDPRLLRQAGEYADQLSTVPPDLIPDRLRRGADAVRALEAAFHGRPAEALRLLGEDGFRPPADLPGLERRLAVIAAIHAQALIGAVEAARRMDDDEPPPSSLPYLVLDVCRATERLRLESRNDGDTGPVLRRLNDLLVRLARTGLDLVAETARQALEHQALRTESRTDALTGVGNRRALDEELRGMLRYSPLPLSLVLVDVDEFKAVNRRFTHVMGDEVLRRVAASLSEQLRAGDRLARYGGDEFVVLLPRTSDTEAEAVATRMVEAVRVVRWNELAEGLRVGVTTGRGTLWSLSHRRPDGDAEHLLRLAGTRLLEGKQRRAAPPARDPQDPLRSPAGRTAEDAVPRADLPGDPPAGEGRATTAELYPSFTGELPLYQALLRDPPRVDPYLGPLPPLGLTPLTAPDAFTRPAPEPDPAVAPADPAEAVARNPSAEDRSTADAQAPDRPRNRPRRRRPNVIDLNAIEKRRSPFG